MGTAREPVTGSGTWPPWTASVSNRSCVSSSGMESSSSDGADWPPEWVEFIGFANRESRRIPLSGRDDRYCCALESRHCYHNDGPDVVWKNLTTRRSTRDVRGSGPKESR